MNDYVGWVIIKNKYINDRENMLVGTFTRFLIYNPATGEIKEIKSNDCGCGYGSMRVFEIKKE